MNVLFFQCNEWNDNREIFGCNTKGVKTKLRFLCNNVKIKAGTQEALTLSGSTSPRIWVFRGGKFWVFDNKVSDKKPFGELLDGAKIAGDLWDGIHFPGGAGFDGPNFIMVYKRKWSRWTTDDANNTIDGNADNNWLDTYNKKMPQNYDPNESTPPPGRPAKGSKGSVDQPIDQSEGGPNGDKEKKPKGGKKGPSDGTEEGAAPAGGDGTGNDTFQSKIPRDIYEQPIGDEMDEIPKFKVGTDGDSALIRTNVKRNKLSKVLGEQVCHYHFRGNKCYQRGNCTDVTADKNNFPAHIVAAIQAKDKYWYFINKEGQYCKRQISNYAQEVSVLGQSFQIND